MGIQACADASCTQSNAGSPLGIGYSVTIAPPASALDARPQKLVLEGEARQPLSQLVQVTLPAGVTSYTATPTDPATVVDQVTAEGFRVTVPGRTTGTYTTTVELAAGTLKRAVTVEHTATPRRLKLAQTGIALQRTSGEPATATLGLVHLPEGQTGATVSSDGNPWLRIEPASGGWVVAAASLPAGSYVGSVSVQSGVERVTVPVYYDVLPRPGASGASASTAPA